MHALSFLGSQLEGAGRGKFFTSVFKDATGRKPFAHLLVDLTPECPEKYRYRSDTLAPFATNDREIGPCIIYQRLDEGDSDDGGENAAAPAPPQQEEQFGRDQSISM